MSVLRKGAYVLVGVLLLPMCLGVAYSTFRQIAQSGDFRQRTVFFFMGFVSYLTFFLAFRKPLRAYLVGHELTHVLWVWAFRGKVREVRLSETRGQVKATKANVLIALAPYFFPIYTLLLIGAYGIASRWINFGSYFRLVIFAIGFTWSFHLLLNVFILSRGQEDAKMSGSFFSLVVIFVFNLVVLGVIMAFVSEGITLNGYLSGLTHDVAGFYTAIGRVIGGK